MAERIEDGGPIHPIPEQRDPVTGAGICEGWHGMTLRDWFAGQFATSIVGDREQWLAFIHDRRGMSPEQHVATEAYLMADAMLKARAPASSPESPHV